MFNLPSIDTTMSQEPSFDAPPDPEQLTTLVSSDPEKDGGNSSSCSSDYEDIEYFEKFSRTAEPNYLDVERVDDETDPVILLDSDDTDFGFIQKDQNTKMICSVCCVVFKSKVRFVIHQRRHFAVDHFKCPVCHKGFTKLRMCQSHELAEHSSDHNSPRNDAQADPTLIVTSTSLYPYSGPEVLGIYKSYEIEVKHGRPERKSHARLQSKYILESQRRLKRQLKFKEAQLKRADKRRVQRALRRAKAKRIAEMNATGQTPVVKVPIPPVEKRSHIARAHPARQRQTTFSSREFTSGPKCYFCRICTFTSEEESGVHAHRQSVHPEVPVSELINFFFIDRPSSRPVRLTRSALKSSNDASHHRPNEHSTDLSSDPPEDVNLGSSSSSAAHTDSPDLDPSESFFKPVEYEPAPGRSPNSCLNPAPGSSSSLSIQSFSCTQCDFVALCQDELEQHEQRTHN